MRVVGSVEISRPASQVWAYAADYGNDTGWRAAVSQMHPSLPGPVRVGVTTHERLRLLGMAGPAGGLRPPSGPAATRRSPRNRPHPLHPGGANAGT
jgi:hypothetical protein